MIAIFMRASGAAGPFQIILNLKQFAGKPGTAAQLP
jgi:hypothetical protein